MSHLNRPALQAALQAAGADFAVLVGSRACGQAHRDSDWDIAVALPTGADPLQRLDTLEALRYALADILACHADQVDLIDLYRAGLAMREQAANHGLLLHGQGSLAWSHFLTRTWRELEDFSYEQTHGL